MEHPKQDDITITRNALEQETLDVLNAIAWGDLSLLPEELPDPMLSIVDAFSDAGAHMCGVGRNSVIVYGPHTTIVNHTKSPEIPLGMRDMACAIINREKTEPALS